VLGDIIFIAPLTRWGCFAKHFLLLNLGLKIILSHT